MSTSTPVAAPGWYPDAEHRHEQRYWDGTRWTDQVADHGTVGSDPTGAAPPAFVPPVSTRPSAPAPRGGPGIGARIGIALLAVILALGVAVGIALVVANVNDKGRVDAPTSVPAAFPVAPGATPTGTQLVTELYTVKTAEPTAVHDYYKNALGPSVTQDLLIFIDFHNYLGTQSGSVIFSKSSTGGTTYQIQIENPNGTLARVPAVFPLYAGSKAFADDGVGPALKRSYVIENGNLQATIDYYLGALGDHVTDRNVVTPTNFSGAGHAGRLIHFSNVNGDLDGSVDVHAAGDAPNRVLIELSLEH